MTDNATEARHHQPPPSGELPGFGTHMHSPASSNGWHVIPMGHCRCCGWQMRPHSFMLKLSDSTAQPETTRELSGEGGHGASPCRQLGAQYAASAPNSVNATVGAPFADGSGHTDTTPQHDHTRGIDSAARGGRTRRWQQQRK